MYPRPPGPFDRLPGPIYILRMGPSQATDGGAAYLSGYALDGFEIALLANRKAGLYNVHPQLIQLAGYLQLFLEIEHAAGGLLAVP